MRTGRDEDVLEEVVAAAARGVVDRVADRRSPVEERLGLPDEVVVVARPAGVADEVDREQQGGDRQADQRPSRRTRSGHRRSGPLGRPTRDPALYSAPPQRSFRRLTSLASPTTGVPDRGTSAPRRSLEAVLALSVVLILGLAFRLIIAYVLLPGSGFGSDRASFQAWANDLATHGPFGFYEPRLLHRLHPGLPLCAVAARGGRQRARRDRRAHQAAGHPGRRRPGLARPLVRPRARRSRRAALLGAILILVNPVTWFDSAIWGQVDSVGVDLPAARVRDLWRDRPERASFFAVVAAIIKPQLGILIPILVVVLLRRHLIDWLRPPVPTEADDDPATERPAGPPGRALADAAGRGADPARHERRRSGSGPPSSCALPFGLSLVDLFKVVAKAAGGYPYVSVNAYNPWALLLTGRLRAGRERVLQRGPRRRRDEGRRDRDAHRRDPGAVRRDRAPADRDRGGLRDRGDLSAPIGDHPARGARRTGPRARRRPSPARRGADVPGGRVLHPADPRPRALSVPGVRARGDPGGDLVPLARRPTSSSRWPASPTSTRSC